VNNQWMSKRFQSLKPEDSESELRILQIHKYLIKHALEDWDLEVKDQNITSV